MDIRDTLRQKIWQEEEAILQLDNDIQDLQRKRKVIVEQLGRDNLTLDVL